MNLLTWWESWYVWRVSNLYYLIVSLKMETENVSDRSNNISVSIELQNVMNRYGTDQKAILYNGNTVLVYHFTAPLTPLVRTCTYRVEFLPVKWYILSSIHHQNSKGCVVVWNVLWSTKFTSNIETVNAWWSNWNSRARFTQASSM